MQYFFVNYCTCCIAKLFFWTCSHAIYHFPWVTEKMQNILKQWHCCFSLVCVIWILTSCEFLQDKHCSLCRTAMNTELNNDCQRWWYILQTTKSAICFVYCTAISFVMFFPQITRKKLLFIGIANNPQKELNVLWTNIRIL